MSLAEDDLDLIWPLGQYEDYLMARSCLTNPAIIE